ncbi:hypothetical protein [Photobacterium leiognathi]|uniref:hypothetical protein n=1 Tax=Photobacterium leiognathi TaxID=553611 RepID=UPI002981B9A1|nr:hypothetical protein [Photobacterium leiognathi]
MKKILLAGLFTTLLTGCAASDLSVKKDDYSGNTVVSSNNFYYLTPFHKWSDVSRIAFKYDYTKPQDVFVLRAGYLTGYGNFTGHREGITNVEGITFNIDGNEVSFSPQTLTNYKGIPSCNEVGICSVADGSYNNYVLPVSFIQKLENANLVNVKINLGDSIKTANLKSGNEHSDAYDVLMKFGNTISSKM